MQATVLSFFRAKEWITSNKNPDVLPLLPVLVSATTRFPSVFFNNVPTAKLYGSNVSTSDFVQIVVAVSPPTEQEIEELIQTHIPLLLFVLSPTQTPGGAEVEGLASLQIPNEIRDVQLDTLKMQLADRHRLLVEWLDLSDKNSARAEEFLAECDPIFQEIVKKISSGDFISATTVWFARLETILRNLENVSERFLRMEEVVPDGLKTENFEIAKRYKPMTTIEITAPSFLPSAASANDRVKTSGGGGGGAGGGGSNGPEEEPDLDIKIARLSDPLTRFIGLAVGVFSGKMSRAFWEAPVISKVYATQDQIDEYLKSTHVFVHKALRDMEVDVSGRTRAKWGLTFHLGGLLTAPQSLLFALCAKLAGLHMRKSELYAITRNGFTAHGNLEHMREVNETLQAIHNMLQPEFAVWSVWSRRLRA